MEKRFCSFCGHGTAMQVPPGDNRARRVCTACGIIDYENPRIVVGCVPEHGGRILLCRRGIEPRRGYWTVPAGFLENGETLEAGAARESWEEALADVVIGSLLAVVNIPEASQVHVFFRARLATPEYGVGQESLEAAMVEPAAIPWEQIAFRSTHFALQHYLADRAAGSDVVHTITLESRASG